MLTYLKIASPLDTMAWSIRARGDEYNPSNKQCRLRLLEKKHILFKPEGVTLNKR